MKSGWEGNDALRKRVRRADPGARVIVEAVTVEAEDVRRTRDDWSAASRDASVLLLDEGGVTLSRSSLTILEQATGSAPEADLASAAFCAVLQWTSALDYDRGVTRVRARLLAQRDPALEKEVATWRLRLHHLVRHSSVAGELWVELQERVRVDVPAEGMGVSAVDVDFALPSPVYPGGEPAAEPPNDAGQPGRFPYPTSVITIAALRADGGAAGNVAWIARDDDGVGMPGDGAYLNGGRLFDGGDLQGRPWLAWPHATTPVIAVFGGSYAAGYASFDGAANRIELGEVDPDAAIELAGTGETPRGSSLRFEASADAETWHPYTDGDVVGEGALAALPRQSFYYLRVLLEPNAGGTAAPVARTIGARAGRIHDLDGLATVEPSGWSIDPVTLKAEITEATIRVLRDGERDYRDRASELLATLDVADLHFRVWIGHPRVARWLLVDVFAIDDYTATGSELVFTGLNALHRLRTQLPVAEVTGDPVVVERADLAYGAVPIPEVYADLLDARIALEPRFRGPGIPPTVTRAVTRTITADEPSDAKDELDAVAYLAGGAAIASQGVVKYVDVFGERAVVASFPSEEVRPIRVSPGLRQRIPEFFVPWGWDGERFAGEARGFDANALLALGAIGLDAPRREAEIVSRWIDDRALAEEIARRQVTRLGAGLMLWEFETAYPNPQLEPGDRVSVQTDLFVARDPASGRAVRGVLWATGTVVGIGDVWGRQLRIWIMSPADIAADVVDVTLPPPPELTNLREVARCGREITIAWTRSSSTEEVYVFDRVRTLPVAFDPWPTPGSYPSPTILPVGTDAYTFEVPPDGAARYLQIEPLRAGGVPGTVHRVVVEGEADPA